MSLSEKILKAGVVGAGGAGFPTHIKAQSNVEFILANGAECEPLLHKDYEIMLNHPAEIVEGMNGNICRCNGYPKIVKAIRRAAEKMKG